MSFEIDCFLYDYITVSENNIFESEISFQNKSKIFFESVLKADI